MPKFYLYEGNRKTGTTVLIGEGSHNPLGDLMNAKRHFPPLKKSDGTPFYQLYEGRNLRSSTF